MSKLKGGGLISGRGLRIRPGVSFLGTIKNYIYRIFLLPGLASVMNGETVRYYLDYPKALRASCSVGNSWQAQML